MSQDHNDIQLRPISSSAASGTSAAGTSLSANKFPKPQDTQHPGIFRLWKWELLTILLSIGTFCAIAAILFVFSDTSYSSWHSVLQPSTIISALSTVSQSALLMVVSEGIGQLKWVYFSQRAQRLQDFDIFDNASRGPLGCVQLLYKINWRATMASIGAIVTLVALAMAPFVQQVVSIEQRFGAESTATKYIRHCAGRGIDTSQNLGINGAIYSGLLHSQLPATFYCPWVWNSSFYPIGYRGRNKTGAIGTFLSIKFEPEDVSEPYVWNCVVQDELVFMDETGCLEPNCTDNLDDRASFYRWQKPVPSKAGGAFIPTVVGAYRIQDAPQLDYGASQEGQPNFFEQFRPDPKAFFINIGDGMTISAILQKVLTTGMLIWSDDGQDGVAQALNQAGNLSATMDHLAHAMTAAIRQGPNRTHIEGTTMIMEQYIVVSWWWLTLPALLVFSSVMFLIFSIMFAAEGDRAVWKSGTIPTLFHGLSGWTDQELCKADLDEMEKLAAEMLGRLEETSDGHLKIARQ
ncbi:hypothetical protein CBER1_06142 [Cercospora berteroae]|uniref:Uncharacterized protein n=1 Tax=Cercospora berteroae TaxID=357750 RepID=A0A2S6C3J2_9PEZI|nr:hypothetical protein CBER1_06142 [Cercospora berteroae]